MSILCSSRSVEITKAIGTSLAEALIPDGIVLLYGDLGSGKTVLTQGLALGLGIRQREIQSPSYTLVREHEGAFGRLIHVDLYRLDTTEVEGTGLWEVFCDPGVKVVEWAERLPFDWPAALRVSIRKEKASETRRIEVGNLGARAQLERSLEEYSATTA